MPLIAPEGKHPFDPVGRQPSAIPQPKVPLKPEGEISAGRVEPPAPSWVDFISNLLGAGQVTGGGQLNLDPTSIYQNGSVIAPGEFEQSVQARNDIGTAEADRRIAAMRANNARHRQRIDQLAPPAQVIASRKLQGTR